MRELPASIRTRIESAMQTLAADADPRMEVFITRTARYIQQGTLLNPRTIRQGPDLGRLDLAVRREDPNQYASELVMIYIEDGWAKVATLDAIPKVSEPDAWDWQATLAEAVDVAVEFDGRWERIVNRAGIWWGASTRFVKVSVGDPWLFWVTPGGNLMARHGLDGATITLSEGDVTRVAALRGWKNIRFGDRDHGLVAAFIKDGHVRYRSYAEQADTSVIWEPVREVPGLDTTEHPAGHVSLFCTNDYRVGVLAEIAGQLHWAITHRNWAGMGIDDERIGARLRGYQLQLHQVEHIAGYTADTIGSSITGYELSLLWAGETTMTHGENLPSTDTVTGEAVGTGDDTATVFSLLHTPEGESEAVYIDAAAQVRGVDYTIAGPEITFTVAPPDGAAVTADYDWENWARCIRVTFDHGVEFTDASGLTVQDEAAASIGITAIAAGDNWRQVILETVDFNGAMGDITVIYSGTGTFTGVAGQTVGASDITFTPQNLTGELVPVPEVEEIWNE